MQRSRRWFLRAGALWSSVLVACRSKTGTPAAEPRSLGATVSSYGSRSRYETATRDYVTNTRVPLEEAASRTPLRETYGMITPSSLHFERHHSGVPEIDPAAHTLLLRECGIRPDATWLLAEGADASKHARSIPIAKAMDE